MPPSEIFLHFFFISLFLTTMVASEDNCSYPRCSNNEVPIQFPFSLAGDQCGYPGFGLYCNKMNSTALELGLSGAFLVRDISYATQAIQLYDEHDCLPRRLLSLDLSGSPFRGAFSKEFLFFNCSANYSTLYLEPVGCLSTSSYSIFATSRDRVRYMSRSSCDLVRTVAWPVFDIVINNDLQLVWDAPDVERDGKCGLKCFKRPPRGLSKGLTNVLIIVIGIPTLVCLTIVVGYLCGNVTTNIGNNNHHRRHLHLHRQQQQQQSILPEPTIYVVGLDEFVIQSYPETVFGESHGLVKPDDNTCSICLSEYRAKETIRTIPACKHFFHAACIDEWLRRNITCPLCRISPHPA